MAPSRRAAPLVAILALTLLLGACSATSGDVQPADETPAPAAVSDTTVDAAAFEAPAGTLEGTVVETMDAGGYTYALVQVGDEQHWAAGPPAELSAGTRVRFENSMAMNDFHSGSLDRTFDRIFFTSAFEVLGE